MVQPEAGNLTPPQSGSTKRGVVGLGLSAASRFALGFIGGLGYRVWGLGFRGLGLWASGVRSLRLKSFNPKYPQVCGLGSPAANSLEYLL